MTMRDDDGMDRKLAEVADELRREVSLDPWLDQRIMQAVRAHAEPRGLVAWFRRTHWVALTPLQAAAALLLVAGAGGALAGLVARRPAAVESPMTVVAASLSDAGEPVAFLFHAPAASRVALVGSFNGWDDEAMPMEALPGGLWRIEVRVPAGRHAYSFLIDGERWAHDPLAPRTAEEDFGRATSVLVVPEQRS
jgi:hypothetical protein